MSAFKSFFLGVISILALLAGIGFLLPSNYRVEESIYIQVSPAEVFEQVNNLPNWENWAFAGYGEGKPEVRFMGPVDGAGAIYTWEDDLGGGRMEIISSTFPTNVQLKLMTQGGVYASHLYFVLEPQDGGGTLVHWSEEGDLGLHLKARYFLAMGVLEKAIAANYQTGLQALKARCELPKGI